MNIKRISFHIARFLVRTRVHAPIHVTLYDAHALCHSQAIHTAINVSNFLSYSLIVALNPVVDMLFLYIYHPYSSLPASPCWYISREANTIVGVYLNVLWKETCATLSQEVIPFPSCRWSTVWHKVSSQWKFFYYVGLSVGRSVSLSATLLFRVF